MFLNPSLRVAGVPPTRDGTELHICIPISPPGCQHYCLIQTSTPSPPHFCSTGTRWLVGLGGGRWEEEHEISPIELLAGWLAGIPNCTYIGSTVSIYRPSLLAAAQFRPQLKPDICLAQGIVMSDSDCQWLYFRSNISA